MNNQHKNKVIPIFFLFIFFNNSIWAPLESYFQDLKNRQRPFSEKELNSMFDEYLLKITIDKKESAKYTSNFSKYKKLQQNLSVFKILNPNNKVTALNEIDEICDDPDFENKMYAIFHKQALSFLEMGRLNFQKKIYLRAACSYHQAAKNFELANRPYEAKQNFIKTGNYFILYMQDCLNNNKPATAATSCLQAARAYAKAELFFTAHEYCILAITLYRNASKPESAKIAVDFEKELCENIIGPPTARSDNAMAINAETHIKTAAALINQGDMVLETKFYFAAAVYFRLAAWHYEDAKSESSAIATFIKSAESFEQAATESRSLNQIIEAAGYYSDSAAMYKKGKSFALAKKLFLLSSATFKQANEDVMAATAEKQANEIILDN